MDSSSTLEDMESTDSSTSFLRNGTVCLAGKTQSETTYGFIDHSASKKIRIGISKSTDMSCTTRTTYGFKGPSCSENAAVDSIQDTKKARTVEATDGFNHKGSMESLNGVNHVHVRSCGRGRISGKKDLTFLRRLVDIVIKDGLINAMDRNSPVVDFHHPEELRSMLKDLGISRDPASEEQLVNMCREVIKYSVKTSHPRFYNQLFGGMDEYSLGGAFLTEALNTSQYTYEVAPVFTLMENEIYSKMLNMVGFDGGEAIFVPGGSMGNIYGMNLARFHKFPEVKTKGLYAVGKPLCIFTSEKGHYSVKKAAGLLGLGTENIFQIKTDKMGKMIPSELETQIHNAKAQGFEPFFVNATAGTTVFGAYDPIEEIAHVCKDHGLWLHVDGAWGGSAIISEKYRHLLKGVCNADSMTWNPHKMMGAPLQCAVFLTKHKGLLQECHCAHARYLFQQDKHYDVSYDTGDKSLQCGRKVDVLKLWMLWKGKGDSGMEEDIDHLFMLSRYLARKLKETTGFRLILEPECTNVCFWYIPPSLREQEQTQEWWNKLAKVAPVIKARMMQCGSMMIGYNPEGNLVNFFRMVLSNCDSTIEDMDFVIQEIERLGKEI